MNCTHCGSPDIVFLSAEGLNESFKCRVCDQVSLARKTPPISELLAFSAQNDVLLTVILDGQLSPADVAKVKSAVPALASMNLRELNKLLSSGKINLGRVYKGDVDTVRDALNSTGIPFSFEVAAPT